ncbi:MAG: sigma-70 family RNA polymerase sigma factor [Lachnospiraceae bacterium]|nr:sigma-70 family RNA polymerase sigma factor [Lachnospiraceae bacterium]
MATMSLTPPAAVRIEYGICCLLFPDICFMADTGEGAAVPVAKSEEEVARAFDRNGDACLRLAYSYLHNNADAEDILQEVFIRYMQKSPEFESPAHEKAWLLRVTANLSKNRIDYKKVRDADELSEELIAEEREDLSFVWEAVKSLPENQRSVIHLFYQEGYQTAEIAEILDMKESTVRSHLKRGRDRLKDILKEEYDFDEI